MEHGCSYLFGGWWRNCTSLRYVEPSSRHKLCIPKFLVWPSTGYRRSSMDSSAKSTISCPRPTTRGLSGKQVVGNALTHVAELWGLGGPKGMWTPTSFHKWRSIKEMPVSPCHFVHMGWPWFSIVLKNLRHGGFVQLESIVPYASRNG